VANFPSWHKIKVIQEYSTIDYPSFKEKSHQNFNLSILRKTFTIFWLYICLWVLSHHFSTIWTIFKRFFPIKY
jgi:hypothetical protein